MLEWLKEILGDAYNGEIDSAVAKKIGEDFVSRKDFNDKNADVKRLEKEVKDRDSQLDKLKNSSGSVEDLQNQIADLQKQNKDAADKHAEELLKIKTDNAVENALSAAGAKNNIAVKALLSEFLSKAKLLDDGSVEGLSQEIKKLSESESTGFLFNTKNEPGFSGMQPGDPGGREPGANNGIPKTYAETVKWMELNPGKPLPT